MMCARYAPPISLVAAMTHKGVIGKENKLPWQIPEELKHFKAITQGKTVIMGSRTFESIGRPLPNRNNIVLGPHGLKIDNVDVCHSVDEALQVARSYDKEICVIGGAYTYAQFLPIADYLYLSYIKEDYEGDVYFPEVDWAQWHEVARVDLPAFEFVTYKRH